MKVTDQLTSNKDAFLTCVNGLNVVTVKERQEEPHKDGGLRRLFWLWTQGTQVASPEQGKKQILVPYLPDRNALYQPLTSGLEVCPGFLIHGAIHRDDVTGDAFNH